MADHGKTEYAPPRAMITREHEATYELFSGWRNI